MKTPSFSYSSLSQFITCPKQYEAHKVLKYVPFTDTDATLYGKDVHSAAEHYIGSGTPLPEKYNYIKSYLDTLNNINGDKFCELELGIKLEDGEYALCEFEAGASTNRTCASWCISICPRVSKPITRKPAAPAVTANRPKPG